MTRRELLLTPGPLTTNPAVRRAMDRDWGSRDPAFIALTKELRERLSGLIGGERTHVAIPLQGSGTYVVEAAISSLIGPADEILILANGAYGERMIEIGRRLGRLVRVARWPEDTAIRPARVAELLTGGITHLGVVHCETTTGVVNPLKEIAALASDRGVVLVVDAMSSLGALPIDAREPGIDVVLGSSNKCLESVPGIAFAIVRETLLGGDLALSSSLSLDLVAQWRGFEANGQWRFTPPVQVVAALVEALRRLDSEGGPTARGKRYARNLEVILEAARRAGLRSYLAADVQSPVIATFLPPVGEVLDFDVVYRVLSQRGFLIYPGKIAAEPSLRIGCIGDVDPDDLADFADALDDAVRLARFAA